MHHPEAVLKPGVNTTRVDLVHTTKLLQTLQPLEYVGVDDFISKWAELKSVLLKQQQQQQQPMSAEIQLNSNSVLGLTKKLLRTNSTPTKSFINSNK